MNIPMIKTYDIDYEFIIKNYTQPSLWNKKWTLFIFKNYIFTLELDKIDVRNRQIYFEIKLSSDLDIWQNRKTSTLKYDIDNMDIIILKKLINAKMLDLVVELEKEYIMYRDETYKMIDNARDDEIEKLKEIAKDFLDENGVSNNDIRDVYIDYYVDANEKTYEKLSEYLTLSRYKKLTDLYLIIAKITKDEGLENRILYNQDDESINEIVEEVNEFMKYLETEEYVEEMKDNLESI